MRSCSAKMSAQLLLVALMVRSVACRTCLRTDVAADPVVEGSTWSLAGCTGLDLSCPSSSNATRLETCSNALLKGDIEGLALALGKSSSQELTSIELRGNWLGPYGAALLSKALAGHASLVSLSLASCRIGDYGAMALVKVLSASAPPQLERLDLSHNSVGDVGVRELSVLLETDALPKLAYADLSWNGIGPRGGRYLGSAIARNTGLLWLTLDWNGLMDRGARALGEGLATNTQLRTLSLEHNAIKNEGGRALANGLRTNGALIELRLDSNGISRAMREEVATAIASTPEAAADERRTAEGEGGDDIEEISFDDEDEAPRAPPAASECVDHGPWECVEAGCPSAEMGCVTLVELGLCDMRFDEIWEEKPPPGIGSLRVWQKCSKACKRCDDRHDEL